MYGCQKVHPYIRPVQVTRKVPENIFANINYVTTDSFCNQNILNSTNIRGCGIKKSRSQRDHCRPRTVSEHRKKYATSFLLTLISTIRDLNKELPIQAVFFLQKKIRWQIVPVARNEWRCVTSPTVPHKIFISIVIGRGFSCTARIYGPYLQVSKMHPYIWAVNTARIRVLGTLPIYMGRTAEKHCEQCFFVRAIYTGRIYGWPVRTTRTYGPYIGPYVRVSKMHPYVRAVNTALTYGCSVHTTCLDGLYS